METMNLQDLTDKLASLLSVEMFDDDADARDAAREEKRPYMEEMARREASGEESFSPEVVIRLARCKAGL